MHAIDQISKKKPRILTGLSGSFSQKERGAKSFKSF